MAGNPGHADRCAWCPCNEEVKKYHDEEWDVPLHDDHRQFKFFMMEVMQCGLDWNMMTQKREIFRQCFDGFGYDKIASHEEEGIKRTLFYEGMIKSHRKVEAVTHNTRYFQKIRQEYGSPNPYIQGFSGGKTILYADHQKGEVLTQNVLSQQLSQDLRKRGFEYLGSVMVYSHLQVCGVINDHAKGYFRYHDLIEHYPTVKKRDKKQVG